MHISVENELRVSACPADLSAWITRRLTIENPSYLEAKAFSRSTFGIPRNIENFVRDQGCLCLPRGIQKEFLEKTDILKVKYTLSDNIVLSDGCLDVNFVGELRPYQKDFVDKLVEGVCGIGVAPPGSGKTVCAISLLCRTKCDTLWITHTSDLANQSIARIKHFTGLSDVGYIGSGKWDIKPVTVALVQTLARRDLSDIAKRYGLVIIDECQHVPALLFNQVAKQLWAARMIGLSATPYRKDGLEPILFDTLGPTLATVDKKTLISEGRLCPATITQKELRAGRISQTSEDFVQLSKQLACDVERNLEVVGDVAFEYSLGHRCIVLVSKIEHGKLIETLLNKADIPANLVFSTRAEYKRGKRVGTIESMSKKEREAIIGAFVGDPGNSGVLIATLKLLAEGFDYDKLDRLFLAAPVSPRNQALLEQTCGRVERPAKNKLDSLVYDYIDKNPLLQKLALKRRAVYAELQMPVRKE